MNHDDITGMLKAWSAGDAAARDAVFERMYAQLKRLAVGALRAQAGQATFEPTVLLNDALLKLVGSEAPRAHDRGHFAGIVARAMRQVLVDRSRRRLADKRGAGQRPLSLDEAHDLPAATPESVLGFDRVLDEFADLDPQAAEVVHLRVFAGLTIDETAQALGLHPSSVNREWAHARAWLKERLDHGGG
ncbi:ECF-type sigma factor [Tahibacter soli]|uniref:ECF-type sigma factor n=1 Tax=Tahibacter soli TaxID=2983605 RepID=A0A9X3YJT5_9GAMM|nr:ECF-type sigma factor [Tahibacter soli]MDC8012098.1 ECF-type sigma factor [Tahibacter soli]